MLPTQRHAHENYGLLLAIGLFVVKGSLMMTGITDTRMEDFPEQPNILAGGGKCVMPGWTVLINLWKLSCWMCKIFRAVDLVFFRSHGREPRRVLLGRIMISFKAILGQYTSEGQNVRILCLCMSEVSWSGGIMRIVGIIKAVFYKPSTTSDLPPKHLAQRDVS